MATSIAERTTEARFLSKEAAELHRLTANAPDLTNEEVAALALAAAAVTVGRQPAPEAPEAAATIDQLLAILDHGPVVAATEKLVRALLVRRQANAPAR